MCLHGRKRFAENITLLRIAKLVQCNVRSCVNTVNHPVTIILFPSPPNAYYRKFYQLIISYHGNHTIHTLPVQCCVYYTPYSNSTIIW